MNICQMRFKLVCLFFLFGKQTSGQTCYTPDKQQGHCLPLHECSKAYRTFAQPPKGSETHLRRFLCKDEKQLKVCCGTAANFTLSIDLTPAYVDISKQQLSKDLFEECDLSSFADIDLPVILAESVDSEVKPKKCLGILANSRYVITPAQCVGQQFRLVGVQFRGKNNNSITFGVEEITSHPFFDPVSGFNDIALLRLNQTVSSDDVAVLCLQDYPSPHSLISIYTSLDLFTIVRGLKKTTVSTALLSIEDCEEKFRSKDAFAVVTGYDWCTNNLENATKFICNGLTGVPLFSTTSLGTGFIGFSSSRTVCDDGLPDIYTNVKAYENWLIDQMRPWPTENESCTTPNGEMGQCWSIFYCPALLDAFLDATNEAEAAQLRGFICKEGADKLFVCCVKSSNSTIAHRKYEPKSADVPTKFLEPRLCGLQHRDDYFTSSAALAIDEFPWIALINKSCTGILINSRYVLTSTEGIYYRRTVLEQRLVPLQYVNTTSTTVRLGLYDGFNETSCVKDPDVDATDCTEAEIYGIDDIIRYQFYPEIDVDGIVLLRLNKTVPHYTDFIRPICLPIRGTLTAKGGDIMYMSYWHKLPTINYLERDYEAKWILSLLSYSNQVKGKVSMQLIEKEECQALIAKELTSNKFCARGYEGKVKNYETAYSCGGALMFHHNYRWHIEGLVLSKNSDQGDTYVFVNVSRYIGWIIENMKPW